MMRIKKLTAKEKRFFCRGFITGVILTFVMAVAITLTLLQTEGII